MMRKLTLFLVICLCIGAPLSAQDMEAPGPGLGGIVIDSSTAGDPATFNPLIGGDTASSAVYSWLYPAIVGVSPYTGLEEPNLAGAMASGWEYDESGTVLTVHLRDDISWNDGAPVTSADYMWAVDAVRSGQIDSPRAGIFETMADGTPAGGKIVSIEAPDDYTVVVTFSEADCISFSDVNDVTPVPAHDLARFKGEIELAREAYSQSISEMREIRSRLDAIELRQLELLRIIEPSSSDAPSSPPLPSLLVLPSGSPP